MNPTYSCDAVLDLMLAGALGRYDVFQSSFQVSSLFSSLNLPLCFGYRSQAMTQLL